MKCLDQDSRILPPFSPSLVFRGRRMLWQQRRQPGLFTLSWPLRASADKARHVKSLKTKTNSNDINVLFSCISKSAIRVHFLYLDMPSKGKGVFFISVPLRIVMRNK